MHLELTDLIYVLVSGITGTGGGALLMRRRMVKNGNGAGSSLTSGERTAVYDTKKGVEAIQKMLCQQRLDGKYELYAKLDEIKEVFSKMVQAGGGG